MSNLERAAAIADALVVRAMDHQRGRPAVKVEVSGDGTIVTFTDNSTLTFPELTCGSGSRASGVEFATVILIASVKMMVVKGTSSYDQLEAILIRCNALTITRDPDSGRLSTTVTE